MSTSVCRSLETPENACCVFSIVTISEVMSTFALSRFPASIFPKAPLMGVSNLGRPDFALFWKRLFPTGCKPGSLTNEANIKFPISTSWSSPYIAVILPFEPTLILEIIEIVWSAFSLLLE